MLKRKDYESFEKLVIVHPNIINTLREDRFFNCTLLIEAIMFDRNDIVEYLTTKHSHIIDVMAHDIYGQNAFHRAALCNNMDVMKFLITKDRRGLKSRDDDGWTPLFYAASDNHESMVNFMLNNGVNSHAKNDEGLTADLLYGVNERIKKIIRVHQKK